MYKTKEKLFDHSCPFCDLVRDNKAGGPWDEILLETENFVVIPTKGALVIGWLLIIPKFHFLAVGALEKEQMRELDALLESISGAYIEMFGLPTIFEHGPAVKASPVGCGIDHAHLHLVPHLKLMSLTKELYPNLVWQQVDSLESLKQIHSSGLSYLYLKETDSLHFVSPGSNIPSQLFRRVIAKLIGAPEKFDYTTHTFEENVLTTVNHFKAFSHAFLTESSTNPCYVASAG